MARSEITFQIKVEPSEDSWRMCKSILEIWLNGDPHRHIQIEEQYADDGGRKVRLEFVEGDPFVVREPSE